MPVQNQTPSSPEWDYPPLPTLPGAGVPFSQAWWAHEMTLAAGRAMGEDWSGRFEEPTSPGDILIDVVGEPLLGEIQQTVNTAIVAGIVVSGLALVGLAVGGFAVYRLTK